MSNVSYFKEHLDYETWWENHKSQWLTSLKQSTLYEELKLKYDPQYLEKGLEHLATRRTHAYRYGPAKLLNRQRERYKYLPDAFELMEQVQAKKLFNFCMLWRAEKIKVHGLWHSFQLLSVERNVWSTDFIAPFSEEDLAFLKNLMLDDEFINTREKWKFRNTVSSSDVFHFNGNREDESHIEEVYPLLYKRFDDWFGTGNLLHLPDTRSKKLEELHEAYREARKGKRVPNTEASDPVEESVPFYKRVSDLTDAYFRKEESAEMVRLLDADRLFFPDENTMEEYEFEKTFDELIKAEDPGYPHAGVNWLDATVFLGRRLLFSKIHDVLDDAFAQYRHNVERGIPMKEEEEKDPLHLHPSWLEEFVVARQFFGLSTDPNDF